MLTPKSTSKLSLAQRLVVNRMTDLIRGLATAPESQQTETDTFLRRVGQLPMIKSMLGDEENLPEEFQSDVSKDSRIVSVELIWS